MKPKIAPGAVPAALSGPASGAAAAQKPGLGGELTTAAVDPEFARELADSVNIKIDNRRAEKAFLLSARREFVGDEAQTNADWADRMQAEIDAPGNLRTQYVDRRDLAKNDRRDTAGKDRRKH